MTWKVSILCAVLAGCVGIGIAATACSKDEHGEGDAAVHIKSVAQLPAPIRETLARFGPAKAKPKGMEQEVEHGLATWSAEYHTDGGDIEVTALTDGTLVSVEHESTPDALPRNVMEFAKKTLGARVKGADHVRVAVYELEDSPEPGTVRERFVDPFGKIVVKRVHKAGPDNDISEAITDLPAAARATLEKETGGAKLTGLHRETEWGYTVHAASWQAADGPREVKILGNGGVVYVELPTGPLPARVAALIQKSSGQTEEAEKADERQAGKATRKPGATGEEETAAAAGHTEGTPEQAERGAASVGVERMLLDAWEVRGKQDGKKVEALILATGEVLSGPEAETPDPRGR